ncbi:MAG: hypothetical protein E7394_06650 [Ruminococcaceae bacterium]|nr:hypothetical protein [Oscillospiraceae bacterium]
MKKNKKKFQPMTREAREKVVNKAKALERESNITLISVMVIIVSFFLLLYVHNAFKVNYVASLGIINVISVLFVIAAVVCVVFAIWKKKTFLVEYAVFALILALLYYLLPRGASGIPGLYEEKDGMLVVSDFAMKMAKILTNQNITYSLWGVNVLYCIYTIIFHSVRYTKIKKGNIK